MDSGDRAARRRRSRSGTTSGEKGEGDEGGSSGGGVPMGNGRGGGVRIPSEQEVRGKSRQGSVSGSVLGRSREGSSSEPAKDASAREEGGVVRANRPGERRSSSRTS
jgi:hypothetical protein